MEISDEWVMGMASKTVGEPDVTGRSRRPSKWHLRKRRRAEVAEDSPAEPVVEKNNQADE